MDAKRTVLLRISVLAEVAAQSDEEALEAAVPVSEAIEAAIGAALGEQPPYLGWQSTGYEVLDTPGLNSGRCAVCSAWVTDADATDPIDGLALGAVVDGRLLCDEHLPADHPWAF